MHALQEGIRALLVKFMQKMLNNKHAELAPACDEAKERLYLPTFDIYNPQKAWEEWSVSQRRAIFGPDLNNTLLGVLLHFRKGPVAITADIEQMLT